MIQALEQSTKSSTFIEKKEFARILSAAVINAQFRNQLLADPVAAVAKGFNGETFTLRKEGRSRLSRIKAASLAEFAAQLT